MINNLNNKLKSLMEKEGLDKLDVYFKEYQDFEELPLFSRWDYISFLSQLSFNEKNKLLINQGMKLIDNAFTETVDYLAPEEVREYFICLTITDWDDYKEINCLTPNIFISRKKSWLLSHLKLSYQSSIEENLINEYLFSLGLDDCNAFVPGGENEENKRIYIVKKNILN